MFFIITVTHTETGEVAECVQAPAGDVFATRVAELAAAYPSSEYTYKVQPVAA